MPFVLVAIGIVAIIMNTGAVYGATANVNFGWAACISTSLIWLLGSIIILKLSEIAEAVRRK